MHFTPRIFNILTIQQPFIKGVTSLLASLPSYISILNDPFKGSMYKCSVMIFHYKMFYQKTFL